MKKIALIAAIGLSLFTGFRSEARVNINVQLGAPVMQQSWYANDRDYVYMPDYGVYYNTRRQVYIFPESGRWMTARRLPNRFGNVNYRSVRTVTIRDSRPFDRDNEYRRRYVVTRNDRGFGNNNGRDFDRDRNWNNNDRDFGRGRR